MKGRRKEPIILKTMYGEPVYKKYSDIVKITSVDEAEIAARTLIKEFRAARTPTKKLRVKRVAVLAANRARTTAETKKNLSKPVRERLFAVADIYVEAYKAMEIRG